MSQMHIGYTADALRESEVDRLHKSLRLAGISAIELAERLQMHRNSIRPYLTGKTAMNHRTRIAWALATGVSAEWLETGAVPGHDGPDTDPSLPRLDSNQQPSGSQDMQVSGMVVPLMRREPAPLAA